MRPVSSAEQSRALDAHVIQTLGVSGLALMEVAALGLAQIVRTRFAEEASRGVVVVCGVGNNAGDGYAAARWLQGWGVPVATLSAPGKRSKDALQMQKAAVLAGVPEVRELGSCGLIVDALFGTGLTRALQGELAQLVERINAHPAVVVAADLPSGVHADRGADLGVAVRAQHTVSFGTEKLAHFTPSGREHSGTVEVVDIGVAPFANKPAAQVVERADVAALWPRRASHAYKTSSGHLFVLAGSAAMAGAAVLCCRGALAGGAGLVTLCAPRGAHLRLGALPPEVMVLECGDGDTLHLPSLQIFRRATALACGPGLGGGFPLPSKLRQALHTLWASWSLPVVFDADALVAVEGSGSGAPRVLTPHPGEAARILGIPVAEVQAHRFRSATQLAQGGATALLKGPHTLIATSGSPTRINPTGGPLLATGGTGDVLTGLIGAMLARGVSGPDAAMAGAWVHGAAADALAQERVHGVTASDIASAIPAVLDQLSAMH